MPVARLLLSLSLLVSACSAPGLAQSPIDQYGPQPLPSAQPLLPLGPQPMGMPSGSNPWQLLGQARLLMQQNQPAQALPLVEQFIAQKPLEPEGYFWQGVALDNLNQPEAALTAYGKGVVQVVKAGMDSAELRMNAANDLLKLGRLDQAIEQYRRAAQIDPGLPLVQLNLGRALVEKGDIDGALSCFQRCEDLHFRPYQLAYYRAKAFKKLGRTQDAKAQIQTALSMLNERSDACMRLRQEFSDVLNTQ